MTKTLPPSLICGAVVLLSAQALASASGGEERLRETVTALSTHGSRMAGYAGDRFAADLVERELIAAGVSNVKREPYDVVVPMDHGASLEVLAADGAAATGQSIELRSLWPNLVRTNTIEPPGLEGELIYAGKGEYADFNGAEVQGSVALMEFDSGKNWKNAAALGVAAIIFIEPEETTRVESRHKWSWAPVDVPRFWIGAAEAEALRRKIAEAGRLRVRVQARMVWERHTTWNIWGVVPGVDPALADELVAVQAYYDGSSVVPAENPAAESAASIAALLEFARYLKTHPPGRPVLLLATGSHFLGQRGVFEFFDRHARTEELLRTRLPKRLVIHAVDSRRLIAAVDEKGLDLDALGVELRHGAGEEAPTLASVDIERLTARVKLQRLDADSLGLPLEPDSLAIAVFIAMDLSSHGRQVGVVHSARASEHRRIFVPLGRSFTRYADAAAAELGRSDEGLVNLISPIKGLSEDTYLNFEAFVEDGKAARDVGIMAVNLVTTTDARLILDTPLDTPDKVDFANLQQQSDMINRVLHQALVDPGLFGPSAAENRKSHGKNLKDVRASIDGRVRFLPKRGATPDDPVPNAVVVIVDDLYDYMWRPALYLADDEGNYSAGVRRWKCEVTGFVLDEATGDIVLATDMGERAQDIGAFSRTPSKSETVWTTILFPGESMEIHERIHALFHWTFGNWYEGMKILDRRGAEPRQYGVALGDYEEQMMVLFGAREDSLRLVDDSLMLLNNEGAGDEIAGQGKGFDMSDGRMVPHASLQSATDMWRLNDVRIERMRQFAIENPRVDALHERARVARERAEAAMDALDWGQYAKHIREALGFEYRAYPDVKGTQSDVMNGLVFFVALLIPAAFFSERLIFASTDVHRQLVIFGVITLVVWIILSQVHPAFGLAHPIIVLLALMVMGTAFFVISLIVGRFNGYMDELREQRTGTVAGDLSRAGTAYAAFMLGISNMRRRALRTCLTLGTITVLTFTVLSFTSTTPAIRFVGFEKDWVPSYAGALLHDVHWWPWEPTNLDYVESHFGEHGTVVPRSWLTMGWRDEGFVPIRRGNAEGQARGVLGLTADEPAVTGIDRALTAGTWFGHDTDDGIILSRHLAAQLGVTAQEVDAGAGTTAAPQVNLLGRSWNVVGLFDGEIYDSIHDLNDAPLTPAKQRFEQFGLPGMDHLLEGSNLYGETDIDIGYEYMPANRLAILPFHRMEQMGVRLRSIAIAFDEPTAARELVESYLTRANFRVFVSMPDDDGAPRAYAYTSLSVTGMEGFSNLIIPLLIAALIVLNTMMGAVHERFQEIGVYSSVGLAPVHISFLFIAEACVYGVLGITAGYIIGQTTAKLLLAFDLLGGVSLNYSSTSAIAAAVLVMLVVVASTLYPARIAARVAVPDVVRRWQLPQPEGDTWQFAFPFTANAQAIESLCGFLHSYFCSYGHESVGKMYTEKTRIVVSQEEGHPVYSVQLLLWLAPFDMGVSQYLQFTLAPSDIPGIYGIQLYIERISGPIAFWQRLNLRFMLELRKQFLVWQTLGDELQEQHRQAAKAILGD